jgi:hypothetical protein
MNVTIVKTDMKQCDMKDVAVYNKWMSNPPKNMTEFCEINEIFNGLKTNKYLLDISINDVMALEQYGYTKLFLNLFSNPIDRLKACTLVEQVKDYDYWLNNDPFDEKKKGIEYLASYPDINAFCEITDDLSRLKHH